MARNAASNKVATGLMDIVQQAAIAFLQADTDGDQQLDFDEFKTVMPKHLQGTDDEIFLDRDADSFRVLLSCMRHRTALLPEEDPLLCARVLLEYINRAAQTQDYSRLGQP